MIDIIKQTPAEYSKQSRDYQVLARLYSILFNVSKMYIDSLEIWNQNIENKLVQLRSRTLNFIPNHAWDLNDLEGVTSCFKYLMRNKGTEVALAACVNILMKIEGLDNSEAVEDMVIMNNNNVVIIIPKELKTIGIVEDLIEYLLPAGLTYRVVNGKSFKLSDVIKSDVYTIDKYKGKEVVPFNSELLIGNDDSEGSRRNTFDETFIYNDSEGRRIPEFNSSVVLPGVTGDEI